MEFYNVKKRKKVNIDESKITKTQYGAEPRLRFAVRATDDDGTKLTKFISKDDYNNLDVPTE